MKKIIGMASILGAFGLLLSAACTVDAGIGVGAGAGPAGTCTDTSCGDAIANGLAAGDNGLCAASSDSAYQTLLDCACGGGSPCDAVCGDNLCVYGPESPDCGDCLNVNCGPEHDTCGNN